MLNIYLVRHGQDQDNANSILNGHRDMPLTDLGIKQTEQTALKIKEAGIMFDAIYSSPLQRTFNTAKIIADVLDFKNIEILDSLIERDFGIMTGQKISDIEKLCTPNILKANPITYFLNCKNCETFPQLIERANKLLNFIKSKHQSGSILLVSHGDFGKMIYTAFYQLNWKDVLKQFHFGNSDVLLLSENSSPDHAHLFKFVQYNH